MTGRSDASQDDQLYESQGTDNVGQESNSKKDPKRCSSNERPQGFSDEHRDDHGQDRSQDESDSNNRRSLNNHGSRRRNRSSSGNRYNENSVSADDLPTGCTLYVRNLPTHLRDDDIRSYFSQHGNVIECRIVINPVTKESRGFGFVTFKSPDVAEEIRIKTDQTEIQGRILRVEKARRNKPHDPTPGEYKGPTGSSIKYDYRGRLKRSRVPSRDSPLSFRQGSHYNNSNHDRYRGSVSPKRRRSYSREGRRAYSTKYNSYRGSYYAHHRAPMYYHSPRSSPYVYREDSHYNSRYPSPRISHPRNNDSYYHRHPSPPPRRGESPHWDRRYGYEEHKGGHRERSGGRKYGHDNNNSTSLRYHRHSSVSVERPGRSGRSISGKHSSTHT